MSYSVRKATLEDCYFLAPRLREEDVAEIRAMSGADPLAALVGGFAMGRTWVGCADDVPVVIFGVTECAADDLAGIAWMLATPDLVKHQIHFLRHCRVWVQEMHRDFPLLCNFVDARNTVHIKWLKWCGFVFINLHQNIGVEQRPFWEFVRVNHV